MHRSRGMIRQVVRIGVVAALAACSDQPPTGVQPLPPSFAFVASDPVGFAGAAPAAPSAPAAAARLQQGDSITWVSLPTGTVPGGRSATIRNLSNDFLATADVEDGGFDPVPLAAGVGDSVEVVIAAGSDGTVRAVVVVPARRAPIVIRTVPPKGGTDIPLNSLIRVVFSEPMDPRTLTTATLKLLRDSTPVTGRVAVSADGLRADFVPDTLLARSTAYTLVVAAAAADLSGDALGQSATIEFTTANAEATRASVRVAPESVAVVADSNSPLGRVLLSATARDSNGNELSGRTVAWTSSNPQVARVDSTGTVSGVALGRATITAAIDGLSGTSAVAVLVPIQSVRFAVNPATLPLGQTARLVVTATDSLGRLVSGWRVAWSLAEAPHLSLVSAVAETLVVKAESVGTGYVGAYFYLQGRGPGSSMGGYPQGYVMVPQPGVTVGSIALTPRTATATPSAIVGFLATVRDAAGNELRNTPITWSSGDASASVWSDPQFFGRRAQVRPWVGQGSFLITAASGGRWDTVRVNADYVTFATASIALNDNECGLTLAGAAYCWGSLSFGAGGYGDVTGTSSWAPVAVTGGLTFSQISVGFWYACALTSAGAAYCWGDNEYGQLGTTVGACITDYYVFRPCSAVPVRVSGQLAMTQLSAGGEHACAVTTGGAAYCWGRGSSGELGNGATTNSSTPVPVTGGLTFAQISAGLRSHTCGVTTAGAAYCWGNGTNGELGDGSGTSSPTPVAVAGGLTFMQVAAGEVHSCGLTTADEAYCWGSEVLSGGGASMTPARVAPGLAFTTISAGGGYTNTCGLTAAGAVYCWGVPNTADGSRVEVPPTMVQGGLTFKSVSARGISAGAIGVTTDGVAYEWGLWDSITPYKIRGQR